jgi:hypothetical protein
MKRLSLLFLLALCVAVTTPARAVDDVFLLGFTGYDYENPNTDTATYLAVGEGYKALGFVTSFSAYLAPYEDMVANQYTFFYYQLTVSHASFDGELLEALFHNSGRGMFYEDSKTSGTPALYGVNPPNATAPATFVDGTLILGGRIDQFVVTYDYIAQQGGFTGTMTFDEGRDLGYIPAAQRAGWTLTGLAGRPNPSIPTGYDHQISGECRIPAPVPTDHKTWGALKALYR